MQHQSIDSRTNGCMNSISDPQQRIIVVLYGPNSIKGARWCVPVEPNPPVLHIPRECIGKEPSDFQGGVPQNLPSERRKPQAPQHPTKLEALQRNAAAVGQTPGGTPVTHPLALYDSFRQPLPLSNRGATYPVYYPKTEGDLMMRERLFF